ncbi:MAG: hypothetical protein JWO31_2287 [Phycisphaerales bacterium]|nr:hypothetical protein [Phycisphaerales bacterium]
MMAELMPTPLADARWTIFLLLLPGLAALVCVVLFSVVKRPEKAGQTDPAPGYYHVLGIDKATGAGREATLHAATEQGARGRAEMDGILVTEVRRVNESVPDA